MIYYFLIASSTGGADRDMTEIHVLSLWILQSSPKVMYYPNKNCLAVKKGHCQAK